MLLLVALGGLGLVVGAAGCTTPQGPTDGPPVDPEAGDGEEGERDLVELWREAGEPVYTEAERRFFMREYAEGDRPEFISVIRRFRRESDPVMLAGARHICEPGGRDIGQSKPDFNLRANTIYLLSRAGAPQMQPMVAAGMEELGYVGYRAVLSFPFVYSPDKRDLLLAPIKGEDVDPDTREEARRIYLESLGAEQFDKVLELLTAAAPKDQEFFQLCLDRVLEQSEPAQRAAREAELMRSLSPELAAGVKAYVMTRFTGRFHPSSYPLLLAIYTAETTPTELRQIALRQILDVETAFPRVSVPREMRGDILNGLVADLTARPEADGPTVVAILRRVGIAGDGLVVADINQPLFELLAGMNIEGVRSATAQTSAERREAAPVIALARFMAEYGRPSPQFLDVLLRYTANPELIVAGTGGLLRLAVSPVLATAAKERAVAALGNIIADPASAIARSAANEQYEDAQMHEALSTAASGLASRIGTRGAIDRLVELLKVDSRKTAHVVRDALINLQDKRLLGSDSTRTALYQMLFDNNRELAVFNRRAALEVLAEVGDETDINFLTGPFENRIKTEIAQASGDAEREARSLLEAAGVAVAKIRERLDSR
jgi:hypothetical protein